jgi:hypothetical protein
VRPVAGPAAARMLAGSTVERRGPDSPHPVAGPVAARMLADSTLAVAGPEAVRTVGARPEAVRTVVVRPEAVRIAVGAEPQMQAARIAEAGPAVARTLAGSALAVAGPEAVRTAERKQPVEPPPRGPSAIIGRIYGPRLDRRRRASGGPTFSASKDSCLAMASRRACNDGGARQVRGISTNTS